MRGFFKFFISLFIFVSLSAQNSIRIFVIDISGSMRRNNLHEIVKKELKFYIAERCKINDRIILMTFGTDVNPGLEDREIRDLRDKSELQRTIDKLNFRDQYTWMTKAMDIIGKRLQELQTLNRPIYVYIFTDGINEPPPGYEDDFTFEEIINNYFNTYTREKTYVYVITLGISPDASLRRLEEKGMIRIAERPPEAPIVREIEFSPQNFHFEFLLGETIQKEVRLNIEKIHNIDSLVLSLTPKFQGGFSITLNPSQFKIKRDQNFLEFIIKITGIKDSGSYSFLLVPYTDPEEIIVIPKEFQFNVKVFEREVIEKKEIEILPESFSFKFDLNDTIQKEVELTVNKLVNVSEVKIKFDIKTNNEFEAKIEPSEFKVTTPLQKLKFVLKIFGVKKEGDYSFSLIPSLNIPDAKIIPSQFLFKINVKKPFRIPVGVWISIGLLVAGILGILWSITSIPKFDKEKIALINDLGEESALKSLKMLQPWYSSSVKISNKKYKITGVADGSVILRKDKKGDIYIKPKRIKEIKVGGITLEKGKEKVLKIDEIFEIGDKKFKIKKI